MSDQEHPELRQVFNICLGAYHRKEQPGDFTAWTSFLRDYPPQLVMAAVMEAPQIWPNYMPTVGQLRGLIERLMAKERSANKEPLQPSPMPLAYHGDPRFLELAKQWEDNPLPRDLSREERKSILSERFRELNRLWNEAAPALGDVEIQANTGSNHGVSQ
jgi:hypothetical protein